MRAALLVPIVLALATPAVWADEPLDALLRAQNRERIALVKSDTPANKAAGARKTALSKSDEAALVVGRERDLIRLLERHAVALEDLARTEPRATPYAEDRRLELLERALSLPDAELATTQRQKLAASSPRGERLSFGVVAEHARLRDRARAVGLYAARFTPEGNGPVVVAFLDEGDGRERRELEALARRGLARVVFPSRTADAALWERLAIGVTPLVLAYDANKALAAVDPTPAELEALLDPRTNGPKPGGAR